MAADLGVDYLVEAVFNVPTLADATPAKRRCASNAAGLGVLPAVLVNAAGGWPVAE